MGDQKKGSSEMPSYKPEDLKLPKKFAEKVVELEICIEQGNFSIKHL